MKIKINLFLTVLILALLISCGDSNEGIQKETENHGDITTQSADIEVDLYADLPIGDYDGYTFRVLNNESNFALTLMDAEEQTGEPINDAIYDRNRLVEERLNIKIVENMVSYSDVTTTITNSIAAGEDAYDIFFNESYFVAPLALQNYLVNVYDISMLDFDKSWWAGDMIDSLTIGDKLYIVAGDIHLMLPEATWVIAFNKRILENHNLESPYTLVENNKWTFEKMAELTQEAVVDLNGDGEMTADLDQFGGALYINPSNFMTAAGTKLVTKDSDNLPVYSGMTERDYNIYTDIVSYYYASGNFALDGKTKGMTSYSPWTSVFTQGHSLMLIEPIGSLKRLRDMEDEFGIVPFPKYDESQSEYISLTAQYAAVLGIPVTNSNIERTGTIVEQLSAISYRDIRSVYYDVILSGKYSRDNESEGMLDIVLSTRVFDLMQVYRWGNLIGTLNTQAGLYNTEIVSAIEAVVPAVEAGIAETIEFYTTLE